MSSKTININWSGLTQDVNILLCFDPPIKAAISANQHLVAWKVIPARPGGDGGNVEITYSGRFGFGETEAEAGDVIPGSIKVEVTPSQKVDLVLDAEGYTQWSTPVNDPTLGKLCRAYNRTQSPSTFTFGTIHQTSTGVKLYEPTFYWKQVGPSLFVEAVFHPILKVYVNLDYKMTQSIMEDISSEAIWSQDLDALPNYASFDFTETPMHGYELNPTADD
ncbi:hypothetical protein JAAARDRAFT_42792 [Jaapia argillacea MUCL 33604]|uniref:Uncharacterized protein n=1 Tax=Jaapia argillacea MUCL 33604 TaxID=933084 RepID=A0A067P477_9AGAM|nr:hypothetical protein JAAARDRAFT_42792 [Jaapia argillacea MUCL 33604]